MGGGKDEWRKGVDNGVRRQGGKELMRETGHVLRKSDCYILVPI